LQRTALSDIHTVRTPELRPMRAEAVEPEPITLEPSNVTTAAPVPGPFEATPLLNLTGPYENASDTLPTRKAAVIPPIRSPESPKALLPRTADSEVQSVASAALPPSRSLALVKEPTTRVPSSVTLAVPVPGLLVERAPLTTTLSYENARDTLPTCTPEVESNTRPPKKLLPLGDLLDTALSVIQRVETALVPPKRAPGLPDEAERL
jgi:hypothetical protein